MSRIGPAGPPGSLRARTYEVIFEHHTPAGRAFDVALIALILLSVATVLLDSVSPLPPGTRAALRTLEWTFTGLFTLEYALRVWCARPAHGYVLSFFGLIDLLAVLPGYLGLLLPSGRFLSVVRVLRLMRVFRVLKLVRYVGEAGALASALRASRFKISVFLLAVGSTVIIVGSLMYLIEGPASGFTSIPRAMYWAVVTLTTVGYGDIAPQTTLGQAIASLVMILGYAIIAVPTGIVSAEMAALPRTRPAAVTCGTCGHLEEDPLARFCRRCGDPLG